MNFVAYAIQGHSEGVFNPYGSALRIVWPNIKFQEKKKENTHIKGQNIPADR